MKIGASNSLPERLSPVIICFALLAQEARAQQPLPTPTSSGPVPTVTAETGDTGGLYFGKAPDPTKTKHYYIAAEPQLWTYAPNGTDPMCGKPIPASVLLNRSAWKMRYVQYADENFTARVLPTERIGILGPVLRGITGEYLAVTFLNRTGMPLSMHPHGVRYDKDSEGSYYLPGPGKGSAVAPGAKFTYVWLIDEPSAPLETEPSSKAWLYHSHVSGDQETNLGLVGAIIVTDAKRARADGTPRDVDREMTGLFMIFDESNMVDDDGDEASDYPSTGGPPAPRTRTWAELQPIIEEGERHTINGRVFGNLEGLTMNQGERVRWYLFGLGSEKDFHSAHWHGARVVEDGRRRTDVVELLPASMKVADFKADNPGQWLFHCHVAEHMSKGMFARFEVRPSGQNEVSREPADAFLGMPKNLETLLIRRAERTSNGEMEIVGEVTVPAPFPIATNEFSIEIGGRTASWAPDSSGLCVSPDGILLITNASSIGVVRTGLLKFEVTLKGDLWTKVFDEAANQQRELKTERIPMTVRVGETQHKSFVVVKSPLH